METKNPPKAHLAKGDDFIIVIVFEIGMVREGEEFVFLYDFWSTPALSKERFFLDLLLRKSLYWVIYAMFIEYDTIWIMSLYLARYW